MKYDLNICLIICPVYALAIFLSVSGTGIKSKYVCPGDSVDVFQNITFNNCSSVVSLYIHGQRITSIASWSFARCILNETLLSDYKERVFLYGNGTLSMHDVDPWDEAKYIVTCQMGNTYWEDVVQIIVMAAPANECIPRISHMGSSLVASLKAHTCGKPIATLYWTGYGDVPKTREPVLKLIQGNQDGTYYACIEGPALQCVRNALDFCSKFTIVEHTNPPMETWDVNRAIFIVVGIVLGIILILATAVILIRKHYRKSTRRTLKGTKVLNRRANRSPIIPFGESIGVGEVKKTNPNPVASRVNTRPRDPSDDFHDEDCMPLLPIDQYRATNYDTLNGQDTVLLGKNNMLWSKYLENLSGQQTNSLDKDYKLPTQALDSLKWDDIKQIAKNERLQSLKKLCDQLETDDSSTKSAFIELVIAMFRLVSGTKDYHRHLVSLQVDVTANTYSSHISGTFNESGQSGIQLHNNDNHDANPEQDIALDEKPSI